MVGIGAALASGSGVAQADSNVGLTATAAGTSDSSSISKSVKSHSVNSPSAMSRSSGGPKPALAIASNVDDDALNPPVGGLTVVPPTRGTLPSTAFEALRRTTPRPTSPIGDAAVTADGTLAKPADATAAMETTHERTGQLNRDAFKRAVSRPAETTFLTAAVANPSSTATAAAVVAQSVPQGAAGLVRNIQSLAPMSLRIDAISNSDGAVGIYVYASGMPAFPSAPSGWNVLNPLAWANYTSSLIGFGAAFVQSALANVSGISNRRVSDYINQVVDYVQTNWPVNPGNVAGYPVIVLVGHSNGGQQLQAYAADGKYKLHVGELITFGSPTIKNASEFPISTAVISVKELGDPVVYLTDPFRQSSLNSYLTWAQWADRINNSPNNGPWIPGVTNSPKAIYYTSTGKSGLSAHDPSNYLAIATLMDQLAQNHPEYQIAPQFLDPSQWQVAKSWTFAYG